MKKLTILTLITVMALSLASAQTFNKAKMDSLFNRLSEKNKAMVSLAISKNGRMVYANANGWAVHGVAEKIPATPDTRYRIGSITKMFTGVMILQLVEEGRLSLEDKLDKFFPAIPNASKITIGQMLQHRSGIHNITDDSLYQTYYTQPRSQKQLVDVIAATQPDFEPGTKAAYSNSAYQLLGFIAEKITGKSYATLLKERIQSRVSLPNTYVGSKINPRNKESHSYLWANGWSQQEETDMSIPGAAGSLVSTTTDLAMFIDALFMGKLVSPASLEKMKAIKDNYGMAMLRFPFYDKIAYGHTGGIDGFQSVVGYFPKDSVALALIGNGVQVNLNDVLIGILSIYFDKPYTIPAYESLALTSADLDKYLGVYDTEAAPGFEITVTKEGNTLMAQATGQPSLAYDPIAPHTFEFASAGAVLVFDPEKKQFVLKQRGMELLFRKKN